LDGNRRVQHVARACVERLGEEGGGRREGEERRVEEREIRNILVIYEFAEEVAEPDGAGF
jgi:hypothetical protein